MFGSIGFLKNKLLENGRTPNRAIFLCFLKTRFLVFKKPISHRMTLVFFVNDVLSLIKCKVFMFPATADLLFSPKLKEGEN
jgi:hypothetical protein